MPISLQRDMGRERVRKEEEKTEIGGERHRETENKLSVKKH